jgi:hypothetical protein
MPTMLERQCERCRSYFLVEERALARGRGKFCSRLCANRSAGQNGATKIRETKLKSARGKGRSYKKYHGRHEHRVIMEQILGRPLLKGEVVHHKDGNTQNNAPENLELLSSQGEHARLHFTKYAGCTVPGCPNPHVSLGYCGKHVTRLRKWGDVNFSKYERRSRNVAQGN